MGVIVCHGRGSLIGDRHSMLSAGRGPFNDIQNARRENGQRKCSGGASGIHRPHAFADRGQASAQPADRYAREHALVAGKARGVTRIVRGGVQPGGLRVTGERHDRQADKRAQRDGHEIRRAKDPALRLSNHAVLRPVAGLRTRSADRTRPRHSPSLDGRRTKPANTIRASWTPSSAGRASALTRASGCTSSRASDRTDGR